MRWPPVTLHCGYAFKAFDRDLAGVGFALVCDQHERVEGGRIEAEVRHKTRALDLVRERVERLAEVTSALGDAASASAVAEGIAAEVAAALSADQAVLAGAPAGETRPAPVGPRGLRPAAV